MLNLPFKYSLRNLVVRKVTTGLTVFGIALVVAVFLSVMSLYQGIVSVFTGSGSDQNLIVLRQNAGVELQSELSKEQYALLSSLSGINKDAQGKALISQETVIVLNLDRRVSGSANVTLRGFGPAGHSFRPTLRIVEGRMFRPGISEVIVSKKIADRFKNCQIGQTISFGGYRFPVVGMFEAGGTAIESEILADIDGLESTVKRGSYSSALIQLTDTSAALRDAFKAQLASDSRINLDVYTEKEYYQKQTQSGEPIRFIAWLVGLILSIGACFGTMNTMYAAVSARIREIATLRALGFGRVSILTALVTESVFIGLAGGILGCILGLIAVNTVLGGVSGANNFETFAEVVFAFRLTPELMFQGLVFAALMGFLGGLLPAFRAANTKITNALRQVG